MEGPRVFDGRDPVDVGVERRHPGVAVARRVGGSRGEGHPGAAGALTLGIEPVSYVLLSVHARSSRVNEPNSTASPLGAVGTVGR